MAKELFNGYTVDEDATVRNRDGRVLKPSMRGQYLAIELANNDGAKKYSVHRLVAYAFLGLPLKHTKGGLIVNHKDLDKTNNSLNNLELVSFKENSQHWVDKRDGKVGFALKDFTVFEETKKAMLKEYIAGIGARDLVEKYKTGQTWIKEYVIEQGHHWRGTKASRNRKLDWDPVIELIKQGLTNIQIATQLGIPRTTIHNIRMKTSL